MSIASYLFLYILKALIVQKYWSFKMSLLSDNEIKEYVSKYNMIDSFIDTQEKENKISYGLSSYGYDARISNEFKVFTNIDSAIIDPKNFSTKAFVERNLEECIIPPNSFILGRTVEYFRIPNNILVLCVGKSTYARCGLVVNVTPLEPGWEGYVTLEVSNTTQLPAKIYAGEGICQFLFMKGSESCSISYSDRSGKYMKQDGVTLPKV